MEWIVVLARFVRSAFNGTLAEDLGGGFGLLVVMLALVAIGGLLEKVPWPTWVRRVFWAIVFLILAGLAALAVFGVGVTIWDLFHKG